MSASRFPDWARFWPVLVLTGIAAFLGRTMILGADILWAAAIGDEILSSWSVPVGVPYAVLPSGDWVNVPVLGEIVLSIAASAGPWGLILLQLCCVITALVVTWAESTRQGASPFSAAAVVLLAFGATLSAAVVIRMPVLSLIPWVVLIAILRTAAADRLTFGRAVGVVSLLVVWGNLHGGVLVGCALMVVFAVLGPGEWERRLGHAAIAVAGVAGVFLVTMQGWDTWRYYLGALTNEAARSGTQLWARPSPDNSLDVVMALCLIMLGVAFLRARPAVWEIVAAAGMAVATAMSARHGVWLALFLAPVAARGLSTLATPSKVSKRVVALVSAAGVGVGLLAVGGRVDSLLPHGNRSEVIGDVADGRPILAAEPLAEALAYAGASTIMGNPLDAFATQDQRAYLDFVEGKRLSVRLLSSDVIVVAEAGSTLAALLGADERLRELTQVDKLILWTWSGTRR